MLIQGKEERKNIYKQNSILSEKNRNIIIDANRKNTA